MTSVRVLIVSIYNYTNNVIEYSSRTPDNANGWFSISL